MEKKRHSTDIIDIDEARSKRRLKRQEILAKKNKKKGKKKKRIKKKGLFYFVLFVVIMAVIASSVFHIVSLKAEQRKAEAEKQAALAEKEKLQNDLNHVHDPEYIEEEARKSLRMIYPGEMLYVFPDSEKDLTQTPQEDE